MKLSFSVDQFMGVFRQYNLAVYPMQIVLYFLALAAIYFSIKKNRWSSTIISIILSFLWLWMGIMYHLIFFITINKAAYLFGFVFILQALVFIYEGVWKKKLSFGFHHDVFGITGAVLILFSLVVYPLLGYFQGHVFPSSPTFGLPCPTTIFTFGLLLWTDKKCPVAIQIVPFIWSIIGFSAAFLLGIREDAGLLISGLITTALILWKNKRGSYLLN